MDELMHAQCPDPPTRQVGPSLRRRKRSAGLSMVEVMLALSILAGGLLVMLTMQIQAMRQGRHGRSTTEAARVAQNQMELLHHQAFGTLALTGGWTAAQNVNSTAVMSGPAGVPQVYLLDWMVSNNPDPNPLVTADTFQVDVRVRWTEPNAPAGAPQRSYVISSIRYDD